MACRRGSSSDRGAIAGTHRGGPWYGCNDPNTSDEFRQLRHDLTAVRARPSRADATSEQHLSEPCVGSDVNAVPMLDLRSIIAGGRDVVVLGNAKFRRVQVIESADEVAASAGQTGIGGRCDAERGEIRQ